MKCNSDLHRASTAKLIHACDSVRQVQRERERVRERDENREGGDLFQASNPHVGLCYVFRGSQSPRV